MLAFHALLMAHVGGGAIALISGPVPMLSQKGSQLHRHAGLVYASAMAITALSAFALAFVLHSIRFMGLAVLTSFMRKRGKIPGGGRFFSCPDAVRFDSSPLWSSRPTSMVCRRPS